MAMNYHKGETLFASWHCWRAYPCRIQNNIKLNEAGYSQVIPKIFKWLRRRETLNSLILRRKLYGKMAGQVCKENHRRQV